ncbi:MAG: hypothetical protein IPJ62_11435 [Betaproteobacteria bacterium]|nr:hypothetical protein [Betaproteobacteria bacterium]
MEVFMIRWLISAVIVGTALGSAMPVLGSTCYEVINRGNVVIFRSAYTPVDLSQAGAPAREAMRNRGEHLVIFDADTCITVGLTTETGARKLTTDEIVAQWPKYGLDTLSNRWSAYSP